MLKKYFVLVGTGPTWNSGHRPPTWLQKGYWGRVFSKQDEIQIYFYLLKSTAFILKSYLFNVFD